MTDHDTAPRDYLTLALRRCRLPISVRSDPAYPWCPHERWSIRVDGIERDYGWYPSDTTEAYLRLVRTLDPTAV